MMRRSVALILLGTFLLAGCAETQYRASKIRVQHPAWDDATIRRVAKREVVPGMTGEMVREALGLPDAISRHDDGEKWGYAVNVGDYQPREEMVFFVYFKHGVVTRTAGDRERLKTLSWYK